MLFPVVKSSTTSHNQPRKMLNKLAKPWPLTVGSLIACLLFSACQSTSSPPPVSGHQSANVYASTKELPRRLQRVALLPVYISEYDTQTDNYLDDTYATGLQGQQRFEVVQISRSQMEEWIGKPQVESSSAIPVELFPMIQHQTGAQAGPRGHLSFSTIPAHLCRNSCKIS